MFKKPAITGLLLLLVFVGLLAPLQSAQAMSARQYFAEGNRLFRDDLYWAALLRYRQAADAGMDTPLLHYNSGIANFRAEQYVRAREALLIALEDPALRIPAHYNLGLNAYAMGDTDAALRWFRLARDQNVHQKIQNYAVIAISRIQAGQVQQNSRYVRLAERETAREFSHLELRARVSFGSDDNVFRSPDQPYIDFSDPTLPLVIPEVKSGAFVPLRLSAKYLINSLKYEGFYGAYRLAGRYYQDKELVNANEYLHEISFGNEFRRKEGERVREIYSAFKVAQHDETYYDPDNGNSRTIGGIAIDDRMSYIRYGPEIILRQSHERLAIGAMLKGQLWDYEDTLVVPEYDHEFFLLSVFGQYKFAPSSLLRITVEGYSRRYGDRPAYDLDGRQRIGNPTIRYDYLSLELSVRQRIVAGLWFGIRGKRTERTDKYVAYNDYTRDSYGFELHWSQGSRFDLSANGTYQLFNYPNAFAFHNPVAGRKIQESANFNIIGTYRMTPSLSLVAEARYRETISNDTRIQYERNQYVLGVRWQQ
jgi:tetratricopeptide (TPR) repeat protein